MQSVMPPRAGSGGREGRAVAFVGTYIPRRCGIATFTADLLEAVAAQAQAPCLAVALNDTPGGHRYPDRVRFEIRQQVIEDYRLAAEFLNMNQVGVACLQHEFGIFGGADGGNILSCLRDLRIPLVTTLHTVPLAPGEGQRRVLDEILQLSDRVVALSQRSVQILREVYAAPEEKLALIPHGIPDVAFVDPAFYKDQFGVEGRKVLLTFGLLSPNKGLETMIDALPRIVARYPEAVYLILGVTHPHVKRVQGEAYRLELQQRAERLGVAAHVVFHNRYVDLKELCEFLGAADVYVTPYLDQDQVVSGTLAYSLGAGKAVISTPYAYAREMLAEGRGRLVPFRDPAALADAVLDLFAGEVERHAMRKRAYTYCREMIWPRVAQRYLAIFADARAERRARPRAGSSPRAARFAAPDLPDVDLRHLRTLTDGAGILQHAIYTIPDRRHGYSIDDQARALMAVLRAYDLLRDESLVPLASTYLGYLVHAFNDQTRRFRNFLGYDRRWLDEQGAEDSHGRALWALGVAMNLAPHEGTVALAMQLFDRGRPVTEEFTSPRAWAFTLLGADEYLRRFSGDSEVRRLRDTLARRLFEQFRANGDPDWPWPEDVLTYENGRLPHALLLAGRQMEQSDLMHTALTALAWLLRVQTSSSGCLALVGNQGWWRREGPRARFDQQPVEAQGLVEACVEAFKLTGRRAWLDEARRCLAWFLGQNDLRLPLYDYGTGGCRDGLHRDRTNENQGAESTLAWLNALLSLHLLRDRGTVDTTLPEIRAGNAHREIRTA
ncbi:MAG: glycosyltransferase [Candidatus Methylomirabilales bacterium]